MPELVQPTVAVRASFVAAMHEFVAEGHAHSTVVGAEPPGWAER